MGKAERDLMRSYTFGRLMGKYGANKGISESRIRGLQKSIRLKMVEGLGLSKAEELTADRVNEAKRLVDSLVDEIELKKRQ